MLIRLDGGDKPARLTFLDNYDEDGNYIGNKKKASKPSAPRKSEKKKECKKKTNISKLHL